MSNLIDRLKERLNSMSQEELNEEWEKLKEYNIGPTVDEYIDGLKTIALNKIKFADEKIHDMELHGTWVKNKEEYRQLKKASEYWKKYLKDLSNESNIS